MEWTNEWIEQGKAEGVLVGELKGQRQVLIRQLRRRLGTGADILAESIAKLSSTQLDELADALFDFASLNDATRWLAQHG